MNEAIRLLFEQRYGQNHIKLFDNRLDLVKQLLSDEDSLLKLSKDDRNNVMIYSKNINRLQSYVSQIFSGSGTRRVTNDFLLSLNALVLKKLKGVEGVNVSQLIEKIMNSLKESSTKLPQELEDYLSEFKLANYAAIFTSRPLELEANPSEIILKIRNSTVDGICNYFIGNSSVKQKFKYNLPTLQLAKLLWRRIAYLLIKKLKEDPDYLFALKRFLDELKLNQSNWESYYSKLIEKVISNGPSNVEVGERNIKMMVDEYLTFLNINASLEIFETKEPVFVIPHIILNPNESTKIKGYIFLDNNSENIELYKYQYRDLIVWKDNVWDTVKANKNTHSIPYVDSIEENVVLNFI